MNKGYPNSAWQAYTTEGSYLTFAHSTPSFLLVPISPSRLTYSFTRRPSPVATISNSLSPVSDMPRPLRTFYPESLLSGIPSLSPPQTLRPPVPFDDILVCRYLTHFTPPASDTQFLYSCPYCNFNYFAQHSLFLLSILSVNYSVGYTFRIVCLSAKLTNLLVVVVCVYIGVCMYMYIYTCVCMCVYIWVYVYTQHIEFLSCRHDKGSTFCHLVI